MDGEAWPPPPSPDDVYELVRVIQRDEPPRQRLRRVRLWGRRVLVAEDGRVYCPRCRGLVDVGELGRQTNPHWPDLGLPRSTAAVVLLPMRGGADGHSDDDGPAAA